MQSECVLSEVSPSRQPRRPLTGGFLPGLNHRRKSSSSQTFFCLLESIPHIHFARGSLPVVRQSKSTECLYFNGGDSEKDLQEYDQHYQTRQLSVRHHQRTNSPSTSTEITRTGSLRHRSSSSNLRASVSFGTSNPVVVVDSVALKVRQFSATARSASGLCCIGYSDFLPTQAECPPSQCIRADGSISTRGKHAKRKSSTSSPPGIPKPTSISKENLKPLRVHLNNTATASGEVLRNGNNRTGTTTFSLTSGLIASASVAATSKLRSARHKAQGSNRRGREKVKDKERVKSKPLEDNVRHGTAPPTSLSSSRTRTTTSSHTSKRLSSSTRPPPCDPQSSTTPPAIFDVGHADLAPGIVTQATTIGSAILASTSHYLSSTSPPIPSLPSPDIFSTPSSLEFVFPAFDALDDLIRWDMDSLPDVPDTPSPPDFPGPEIKRNNRLRHSHQHRSDVASCSRSTSSSCHTNPLPPVFPGSDSTHSQTHPFVSVPPNSSSSPSPKFSNLFSTPFDDEPIEYEIPFPSMRRVLMEDMRIKKSKTLVADKARGPLYGSNLGGLTSTLMQKSRYESPSQLSPHSSAPVSSLASPSVSSPSSGSVDTLARMVPSTPPLAPLPPLPSSPKSESRTPSPRFDKKLSTPPITPRTQSQPSLPTGLPSPLLPFHSTQLPDSRVSTPVQMGTHRQLASNPALNSISLSTPSSMGSVKGSTQPQGENANNVVGTNARPNRPIPISQPPRHAPPSILPMLISTSSTSTLSVSPVDAISISPSASSASDSGYGSSSASLWGSGKRRSSPRSSDQEKAKRKSNGSDEVDGGGEQADGKGWGGTTKTWADTYGGVHLGAEDCTLEVIFPQAKDFEFWDMSDSGWVAVPIHLNLLAKDAKRWVGIPLAMPDVTHIDLQCEDIPIPVPFELLGTGTTLSASSSAFFSNSYITSFIGGKSALEDSSSFGPGKGFRSGSRMHDKGRGMSMMEALRKKEEEQSMKADRISIEGKWVRTYSRQGVEGAKNRTSDDFRANDPKGNSRQASPESPGSERSGQVKDIHRGWYLKLWVPIPTRLFVKRETRVFKIRAKAWLMGDEEKEERGLRRGDTLLDRFEIGMEEVEKWLGGEDVEEEEAEPLIAETEMTVSHLRREREMDRWY